MSQCPCPACENERQIAEGLIKAMFTQEMFKQKEVKMKDSKYTHAAGKTLAVKIYEGAMTNGMLLDVFLCKDEGNSNEYLDYAGIDGVSRGYNRQYKLRTPWDNVAVDAKLRIVNKATGAVTLRYFASVSKDGRSVNAWAEGRTSFSAVDEGDLTPWMLSEFTVTVID